MLTSYDFSYMQAYIFGPYLLHIMNKNYISALYLFGICDDENDSEGVDDGQDHDPEDGVPGVPVFLKLRFFS